MSTPLRHLRPILALGGLLWASCAGLREGSLQVIKEITPIDAEWSLAVVGPPDWKAVNRYDDREGVTRLAFVQRKTGRIVLDLGRMLPAGFCSPSDPWPMCDAFTDVAVSPDQKHVVVNVELRREHYTELFAIAHGRVKLIPSFRSLNPGRTLHRAAPRSLWPETSFGHGNGALGASWTGNDSFDVSFTGSEYVQGVEQEFTLSYTCRLEGGRAVLTHVEGALAGKPVELTPDKAVLMPHWQSLAHPNSSLE